MAETGCKAFTWTGTPTRSAHSFPNRLVSPHAVLLPPLTFSPAPCATFSGGILTSLRSYEMEVIP